MSSRYVSKLVSVMVIGMLVFGVVPVGASASELLGASPASTRSTSPTAAHSAAVLLGQPLGEADLEEYSGEFAPWVVGGVLALGLYVAQTWDEPKDLEWAAKALAATAVGTLTAGTGSAMVAATSNQWVAAAAGIYSGAVNGIVQIVLTQ